MIIGDTFCSNVKNDGVGGKDTTPRLLNPVSNNAEEFKWPKADILVFVWSILDEKGEMKFMKRRI